MMLEMAETYDRLAKATEKQHWPLPTKTKKHRVTTPTR